MTRILVQRGSTGSSSSSSSNPTRSFSFSESSSALPEPQVLSALTDEDVGEKVQEQAVVNEILDSKTKNEDFSIETPSGDKVESSNSDNEGGENLSIDDTVDLREFVKLTVDSEGSSNISMQSGNETLHPPSPPVPPPKPLAPNPNSRRLISGNPNAVRRPVVWPLVSTRSSPTGSRPSSPRSHAESEGYNSADEQSPCFTSSYDDMERERQFEIDIRRAKGLEVKRMLEDGNCLFRAIADQVYGDSEAYDVTRQMCIDYMEQERDHFSQFITEGFTSYCRRKRRDKVYGNNVEIQALSEMYNRPIHIYSYSTEPINTFHGSYNTETPPIRLSYHHGNHYNSLVDPRRLSIGAGLGFSCLRGNVDRDQVKAAIKAQQDQQIDNALLAEGRFYSDLELTEKEMELMVMEASRAEYLADENFKVHKDSSTSSAEPSSSGARLSSSDEHMLGSGRQNDPTVVSSSMRMLLSMGFSYVQAVEACSIFGDDVDSMVCYLVETGSRSSRRKGKATE